MILLVVLCWAANFVVVKAAIGDFPPLVFTGTRYVLAAIALLILLRLREGTVLGPRRDILVAMGLGILGFGAYQVLWVLGLTSITAGESALLVATSPIFVALIAALLGVDVLTPTKLAGVLVAFAGVVLVIGAGTQLAVGASLVGDALTIGGAVAWATYTSLTARVLHRISPVRLSAWAVVGATFVLVPLAGWQAATTPDLRIELHHVGALLYSGVLAAGLANVAISHGVKLVGPTWVTVLQNGTPPMAVLLGGLFLAEPILPGHILGGAVIVAGAMVMRSTSFARFRRARPLAGRLR